MKIEKTVILSFLCFIIIGNISCVSHKNIEDRKLEDPYEIKKVQNFNYQPQYYAEDLESGSLLFLTKQGELYECGYEGNIKKIKSIPLKIKKMYCAGEEKECFFIDEKGDLYFTSILDSVSELTKVEGISNVKSFSIARGYYGAVTEEGDLYTWRKDKNKVTPEYKELIPFQSLSNYSPKLVSSISSVESVACSSNYMAVLTKSGEVYECGIKEEEEEKNVEPVFRKMKDFEKILQIVILKESDLIAISKDKIYRIGCYNMSDFTVEHSIDYTIKQMSSGYYNIAYVTNDGETYLFGETFWYHDPNFDIKVAQKLNGIENADAIYGGGGVYVIKDNQIYIITRVNQSYGIK